MECARRGGADRATGLRLPRRNQGRASAPDRRRGPTPPTTSVRPETGEGRVASAALVEGGPLVAKMGVEFLVGMQQLEPNLTTGHLRNIVHGYLRLLDPKAQRAWANQH